MRCRSLSDSFASGCIGAAMLIAGVSGAAGEPAQLAYLTVGVPERRDLTSELDWTDAVAEIQGTLFELGFYKGPIDGRISPETLDAIHSYRRRHGVIDTETTWRAMLTHMRAIGEAMRLQDALKAARERQVDEAKAKLLGHAAARGLVRDGGIKEAADPTHDSSICFAAPTFRCLLDETAENIRAVSREKYRNWALQDLIGVLARAGLIEPMKEAVRRLTDARLIFVSLRDGAAVMAAAGRMDLAEETIALLPEGRDRLRALVALARGWLMRGDRGAAKEVADRLLAELARLGDIEVRALIAGEIAMEFARFEDAEQARRLLAVASGPGRATEGQSPAVRASVAATLAELGEVEAAADLLRGVAEASQRRPAEIVLVGAFARTGALDRAIETAANIDIARYRVVALCEAARLLEGRGRREMAVRALDAAVAHLPEVDGEFATDFSRACIAETHARLGAWARAQEAAGQIEGADLKARTFWRLLALRQIDGVEAEVQELERAATAVTETVDTFKRVSILSDVATAYARSGRVAEAKALLDQAIGIVRNIKARWWRARALCRVATAMIAFESPNRSR